MIAAIIQDGLRRVTNRLAREGLRARAIGRILHVAIPDAELSSVGVGICGVDVVQSCVAVAHAGATADPSQLERGVEVSKRNIYGSRKVDESVEERVLGSYLFE